jgi:20S proteasome alpha/beta subunit
LLAHARTHCRPHIYQIDPSSNYFDCKAQAIGARSQSARTYLERHLDEFTGSDKVRDDSTTLVHTH